MAQELQSAPEDYLRGGYYVSTFLRDFSTDLAHS